MARQTPEVDPKFNFIGFNAKFRLLLEKSRFSLFVGVPMFFGFVLGRLPEFWEAIENWHPSAASNPRGPYLPKELTDQRPDLHSEYQNLLLETALDAALDDIRQKNASK
uniref:Uncharacterized protein n=1 Tax=Polytomella parva TaxID=51329 RepID=A0A7S0UT38_9CHLO|mmetsp:Transcript_13764/g.24240  ORF Transcript_13764/g.24240 Transcript_13764/m.24240 type:complete len:109 (+) Transcript_13764:61-387(+)|eukprot:CAMPEP_0175059884 /NCGR_PEP_ID=MMETSP0052_2-20121109/12683_1 /TAXON_ID=51329 ORGANISM="Polytomella parva, Strain SAG 63-3" /NCGR_SAMPLE_ID=MMETSP0052_2 /ASSEMBLY_ACC=CAM_ASM_000194 /LENGTH=108 /DNA_ID=CAMNT_0016325489 /DNA_START=43 /DNA_END=369 /DNA_ORIENTATION=+